MNKYFQLIDSLTSLGSLAIAYSGGADSALLLYAAREALGDKAFAITISSKLIKKSDLNEAGEFCAELGIRHYILNINEQDIPGFSNNPPDRCYICKKHMFAGVVDLAKGYGADYVAEGSNTDDEGDYRPGMKAIAELGIKSPLREAGFSKSDVRKTAKSLGIRSWNKPSAACLASRFAYGEEITAHRLDMAAEAEEYLSELGFEQFRVRLHNNIARIEVLPEDFNRLAALGDSVYDRFKELGFDYAAMDLRGYRTGSMNEAI